MKVYATILLLMLFSDCVIAQNVPTHTENNQTLTILKNEFNVIERFDDQGDAKLDKLTKLIQLLAKIQKIADPKFDPSDPKNFPASNVMIPLEAVPANESFTPGMDPEAIHDPKMKHIYLEAIKENDVVAERYRFQSALNKIETDVRAYTKFYLRMFFKNDPNLAAQIIKANFSDDASKKLFQALLEKPKSIN